MIPRPFEYFDPDSLSDAVGLLAQYGDDAKLMAGGQSLLPMMKLRVVSKGACENIWSGWKHIRRSVRYYRR